MFFHLPDWASGSEIYLPKVSFYLPQYALSNVNWSLLFSCLSHYTLDEQLHESTQWMAARFLQIWYAVIISFAITWPASVFVFHTSTGKALEEGLSLPFLTGMQERYWVARFTSLITVGKPPFLFLVHILFTLPIPWFCMFIWLSSLSVSVSPVWSMVLRPNWYNLFYLPLC